MDGHVCGGSSESPPQPSLIRRALRSVTAKARPWRTAYALDTLRYEVNARWPNRSKVSDGTIGDAAHASRTSDHNPWLKVGSTGIVRAFDCTAAGIDANGYAEHLRALGRAGDPRISPDGYVIWNKRIASARQGWAWRPYTGANGHTRHIHLSLSTRLSGFDSRLPWGIANIGRPKPQPAPAPVDPNKGRPFRTYVAGATDTLIYKLGGRDNQIAELQLLCRLPVTRVHDPATVRAVVALKTKARWLNASGTRDRSSRVDERFMNAVRALAR